MLALVSRALVASALCAVAAAQWEQIATPTSPPLRNYGGMTFDGVRNRTVVFGGGLVGPGFRNDMWAFDGQTWTQLAPPVAPGPRGNFQMVHDGLRDRIVLFGGRGGTGFNPPLLAETWEFDGTTWSLITNAAAPSARQWFGMAFDPLRDKVVLFSGIDVQVGGTSLTWAWDGVNWAQLPVTGLVPAPRTFARLAYDEGRQAAVLFGGMNPQTGTLLTDVWQFDGASWRELLATGPVGRRGFGFVYDTLGQRCVLFGGLDQSFQGVTDTWKFGPTWTTYGTSCPGSNGAPSLVTLSAPGIARPFVTQLSNLFPAAPIAVFATGLSATSWSGLPLPLPMDSFGMPGCALWISPDYLAVSPAPNGSSSFTLTIPDDPLLIGQQLWQQGLSFEAPTFNAFGGVLSNAIATTIGW